mmetsp:Transcript_103301/g.258994  ORF Transcript_103301/g.258994 Transcript_103301/m.258994 type:complete len:673 (-) Transcript_103301:228-2246(-)
MAPSTSACQGAKLAYHVVDEEGDLQRSAPPQGGRACGSTKWVDHPVGRRRLSLVLVTVASMVLVAGVLWKALAPCAGPNGIGKDLAVSSITLDEQIRAMGDSYDLFDGRRDREAREEWLAAARSMSAAKAEPQADEDAARTRETVQAAMEVSDPVEAEKIMKRAMTRSVQTAVQKRQELKRLLKKDHFFQKRRKTHEKRDVEQQTTENRTQEPATHNQTWNPLFTMMSSMNSGAESEEDKRERLAREANAWGTNTAECIFDVLSAFNLVAGIAADINDAVKTCKHVTMADVVADEHSPEAVHEKVCTLNVFYIIGQLEALGVSLTGAANNCASTLTPNMEAKCSTAIIGLFASIAQWGGAFTLMSAACRKEGWYNDIPVDRFPHNVGSNEVYERDYLHKHANGTSGTGRRLAEASKLIGEGPTAPAPPRQLLFGGGRGSTATQCAVEINSAMWNLADAGLAINQAANELNPACPVQDVRKSPEGLLLKATGLASAAQDMSQGLCAINIEAAIGFFFQVMHQISLAVVNCADTLNLGAMCSAGVTSLLAGGTGIATTGTAIWTACDTAMTKEGKRLQKLLSTQTESEETNAVFNVAARRLGSHSSVEDLKRRFATPEEAWMSIGYDLNNASAVFRRVGLPAPDLKAIASLVEEPEAVKGGGGGLFGGHRTCSD